MSFNAPRREEYDGAKIIYLSWIKLFFFRKIVINKTRSFDFTRAPPGSPTEHASPGGGVIFPPVSSGTKDRRGTREAVIESSRQDDSNQYLKFS